MTFFVLGDEDVVLGYKFIGIQGKALDDSDDYNLEFEKVTKGEYGEIGVLLITEKISSRLEEVIMNWQLSGNYPLIVEIPDLGGHLDEKKSLHEAIRKAIGMAV